MGEDGLSALEKKLTAPQRIVLLETEPGQLRSIREVHLQTWGALYSKGLASYIRADGYTFFDLTPLGLKLRAHLTESKPA